MSYSTEDIDDMLDEALIQTWETYGKTLETQEGDIRNLRRVAPIPYWENENQIAIPVSNEKVQEYLKNKRVSPPVLYKKIILLLMIVMALLGIVNGINGLIREAEIEAAKNYANVIPIEEEQVNGDGTDIVGKAEKTELYSYDRYVTEDKQFAFMFLGGEGESEFGIILLKYYGNEKEVIIPTEMQGYPIVDVYDSVFAGNDIVEKIVVEAEITTGGFKDCMVLKEVIFPATMKKLGYNAFLNTPSLEKVIVNSSCLVDANFAGYDINPEVIYTGMSESVEEGIENVMEEGQTYTTTDGKFQYRFSNDTIELTKYLDNNMEVTIPKEVQGYPVTYINDSTFDGNNFIEKVIIEAEIESGGIGFRDCSALKEVVYPATVKLIGYNTFWNTPNLEAITVSSDCTVAPDCAGYDVQPEITYVD